MSSKNAELHFINTGNSDAILIKQDGKAALIDGGDNDDEQLVVSYLKNQGVKELEYIFATHPHADHIGGLDAVIDNIKVNNLYVSNGDAETKSYRDFIEAASNKGLYPSVPLLGSEFKLSTSTFKVLSVANEEDPNNNSIVLLYTNGNDKILLMGDAEAEIEKNLNPGDVDLLKVGHHGSYSSTKREFIERVTPEYAVILAGEDNKYGHPHVETVDLLKEKNIEVHRSDECSDIVFVSTGNGLSTNCKAGSYNPGSNSKGYKNKNDNYVKQNTKISSSNNTENTEYKDTLKDKNNTQELVYWSKSGKKYHSDPTCSGMKNPISGTINESNRTACSICY
ncbi:ComEC/Rec2 family competence protein [[Clostridium] dakarense]|uniref:ComEC/Rec2 family competence protein n=1 Tax=Faecalimicrobium dakarense TaxID=1301100 RepID=UPI002E8E50DD|nr:ComEC/Rec2 family competence protein [[Clostridium] dakarense]